MLSHRSSNFNYLNDSIEESVHENEDIIDIELSGKGMFRDNNSLPSVAPREAAIKYGGSGTTTGNTSPLLVEN